MPINFLKMLEKWPRSFILLVVFSVYFTILGKVAHNPDVLFLLRSLLPIESVKDYWELLLNFKTIDWQPVRDLTFFFDLFVYKQTGIVFFTTTNVILWVCICILFFNLIRRESKLSELQSLVWSLLLAVSPLATQAVSWGMARKHILAIFFILLATHAFLDQINSKSSGIKAFIFYLCACLSHPLMIMWPIWAFTRMYWVNKKAFKLWFIILYPITMFLLLLVNYRYHTSLHHDLSLVAPTKLPDLSRIEWVPLTFFFDLKQIVFPYQLGFLYSPKWNEIWPGVLAFIAVLWTAYTHRKNRIIISWLIFAVIPFPITLYTVGLVYDQYLLIPTIGIICFIALIPKEMTRRLSILLSLFIIGSGVFSFYQVSLWTNPIALYERNFHNSPSCKSLLTAVNWYNYHNQKTPEEMLQFSFDKKCFFPHQEDAPLQAIFKANTYAAVLFHENIVSQDKLIERLDVLSAYHYIPLVIKALVLSREEKPQEVESVFEFIHNKSDRAVPDDLSQSNRDELGKFCRIHQLTECLRFLDRASVPFAPELMLNY